MVATVSGCAGLAGGPACACTGTRTLLEEAGPDGSMTGMEEAVEAVEVALELAVP